MFQLSGEETEALLLSRSQIAILKRGQNIKYLAYAIAADSQHCLGSMSHPSAPTGLRPKAQGCEAPAFATLRRDKPCYPGSSSGKPPQPQRGCGIPSRLSHATFVTTALRLMISSTMTDGRCQCTNLGLQAIIPLGLSGATGAKPSRGTSEFTDTSRSCQRFTVREPAAMGSAHTIDSGFLRSAADASFYSTRT